MIVTIISNKKAILLISLLVALAFGAWSILLGQDRNWDLLNYHLYNPYAFLNNRIEFDLAPAGAQSYFSPMLDIIYFTAISYLNPKLVGFLIGFLQGLNFFLIYKVASRVLKNHEQSQLYALLLALAGVLCIGFLAQVGSTMHDSLVALFPLLSMWMILHSIDSLDQHGQRNFWALIVGAGLVAGTGIGLKLVSAIYALPLCLAMLILPTPFLRRIKLAFFYGLAVLAGLFIIDGYWLYEVWRLFGNPLFPQFNNYFQGELASFQALRDVRFLPSTLFDKVFYPLIFTFDPYRVAEFKYQQFSWLVTYISMLALLATGIFGFFQSNSRRKPWDPEAVYLLTFFCISYFLWLNIFGIYRYLIVIELLIPLLLFVIIRHITAARFPDWATLACLAVLTMVNIRGAPDWGHSEWADTVYSVEANRLTAQPEPAAIYLAGQPLAWLVPALDLETPFIQIVPNMSVSEAYWQRAKILTANRRGASFVVFESDNPAVNERAHAALLKLGLSVDDDNCDQLNAYLGRTRSDYRFCELETTEQE